MPAIAHPGFEWHFDVDTEIGRIERHARRRQIPTKRLDNVLIASWNLANLGHADQQRSLSDLLLMAAMLRLFDLIAIQEVKDDFQQLADLVRFMGPSYDYILTDRAGNDERLAFIYDSHRVEPRQLCGELVILERERPTTPLNIDGHNTRFTGFNRNPYLLPALRPLPLLRSSAGVV